MAETRENSIHCANGKTRLGQVVNADAKKVGARQSFGHFAIFGRSGKAEGPANLQFARYSNGGPRGRPGHPKAVVIALVVGALPGSRLAVVSKANVKS